MLHKSIERSIVGIGQTCAEALLMFALGVGLKHYGAERWRERQGVDTRDTHGYSHRNTKLRIEYSRRTTHHRYGDKHCHKYQRRGYNRRRYALHSIYRSLVCRAIASLELSLHSLDDDNGIVDNSTDGQH